MIDDIVKENRVVYGITTGFGKFARTVIDPPDLEQLQVIRGIAFLVCIVYHGSALFFSG